MYLELVLEYSYGFLPSSPAEMAQISCDVETVCSEWMDDSSVSSFIVNYSGLQNVLCLDIVVQC